MVHSSEGKSTDYSSDFGFTLAPHPKGYNMHSFNSVGRRKDALLQSCMTLEIAVVHNMVHSSAEY